MPTPRNSAAAGKVRPGATRPFASRLVDVLRQAAPDDAIIHTSQSAPAPVGMEAPLEVRVISASYEGVEEADRQDPLWQAVLDRLWDEQGLVESILTLTPAELDAALNDGDEQ